LAATLAANTVVCVVNCVVLCLCALTSPPDFDD
jgi:hypothetical protein